MSNKTSYISDNSRNQRGVALVSALVLLTIMTILAVAAMSTNSLEEKMASNVQEGTRAFQTAESGIALVVEDNDAFNPALETDDNGTPFNFADDIPGFTKTATDIGTYNAEVVYTSEWVDATTPPPAENPANMYDAGNWQINHFRFSARASTSKSTSERAGVTRTLDAGAYNVAKK